MLSFTVKTLGAKRGSRLTSRVSRFARRVKRQADRSGRAPSEDREAAVVDVLA